MGMLGSYVMADEDIIEKIKSGEISAADILYNEDGDLPEDSIDIGHSWHAIHYILTGDIGACEGDDPLLKVVLGGQPLGDEDFGYGPPLYLSVADVKETNAALQSISNDDFSARFNYSEMQIEDIYATKYDGSAEVFLCSCLEGFISIKEFFAESANSNKCIIFFVE